MDILGDQYKIWALMEIKYISKIVMINMLTI